MIMAFAIGPPLWLGLNVSITADLDDSIEGVRHDHDLRASICSNTNITYLDINVINIYMEWP